MSAIASKNAYELLGNDPELDPDREPEPPTKVIDKPVARVGKRNAGAEGPPRGTERPAAGGRGGSHQTLNRGDVAGGNNRADKRDDGLRNDRHSNRTREAGEFREGRGRGRDGRARGRGGRNAPRDDRHSHTGIGDQAKQAAHGWGGEDGQSEWADERAGEAIANAESKDEPGFTPDTSAQDPAFSNGPDGVVGEEAVPEPEEKTKTYDEYLAELAEKRLALSGGPNVRKPNEGSSQKFPEGKAFSRNPEEEEFIAAAAGKAKKAKEVKEKERINLDGQYYAPADSGDRGGRGGRGRGGGRGGRGSGEFRGRGGRGDRGAPRGDRGAPRGDRGAPRGGFNAQDSSAFPALGGS